MARAAAIFAAALVAAGAGRTACPQAAERRVEGNAPYQAAERRVEGNAHPALSSASPTSLRSGDTYQAAERRVEGNAPYQTNAATTESLAERLARYRADKERLVAAYASCVARLDHPAEGVVVPVENNPDGSLKVDATADRAQFFDKEGLVWCGGVTVREYAPDGSVRGEFRAEGCVVDKATKSGWMEGRVNGRFGKTRLAGDGVYFSFPDEFVKIHANVAITSTDIKFEGVKL